ncbi:hypothetical protein STCU_09974 [Strigomonas culicis]|uniref:Uncharacterized protein n=1 Tax=Strigomonas culicis TaxID=28005 RepID=S9TJW4_9TRYP|nr:hypothetical protein STCU_09974 [Strigomonas culicis]|eukprot:EPY18447.1 hypothetical protein STCU_09974 [Strigomonas culicis]
MNCPLSFLNLPQCAFNTMVVKQRRAPQPQPDIPLGAALTSDESENDEKEEVWEMVSVCSSSEEVQYTTLEAQHCHIIWHEADTFSKQMQAAPVFAGLSAASTRLRRNNILNSVHQNTDNPLCHNSWEVEETDGEAYSVDVSLAETEETSGSYYLYICGL